MNVDTTAAAQGPINAVSENEVNQDLSREIIRVMHELSNPGSVGRAVFDLNQFLHELSKVDFGSDRYKVASLMEQIGKHLGKGIRVASYEDNQ